MADRTPAAPGQLAVCRLLAPDAGLDPEQLDSTTLRLFGERFIDLSDYEARLFADWLAARKRRLERERAEDRAA